MSINFYLQSFFFFLVMSVPNKLCLQQTTVSRCVLTSTSMSEVRCFLPCLCLKQLPSLAVKRDFLCLSLKLITYKGFDCCATCANHLNSIPHIPFFMLCLSQVISILRIAVCCALRESHVTSPELLLLPCVNLTWLLS